MKKRIQKMSKNKTIFSQAKRVLTTALVFLLWLPIISFGENQVPVTPCYFPFEVNKKDVSLDEIFDVKEYRHYDFSIQFEYDNKDMERIRELVGNGAFKIFTKESADTDRPVIVIANDIKDEVRIQEGLRSGIYVTRPTDFSGEISIHMQLEKIDSSDINQITVINKEIRTIGYVSQGFAKFNEGYFSTLMKKSDGGYFEREITMVALKPGRYRVRMNPIENRSRFVGITTRLTIEPHHNENKLTN